MHHPRWLRWPSGSRRSHLREQVRDPELRAQARRRDYRIGCKRMLHLQRLLPGADAAQRRGRHRRDRRDRPRTRSSPPTAAEREVDTIILGTGFHVTDLPIAAAASAAATGARSPRRLATAARRPTSARPSPGFPNLFLLIGPNTGLGHNSIVFMIESQLNYVMDALRIMDARGHRARRGAARGRAARYNDELQRKLRRHACGRRAVRELVPRRERPQHDALAGLHLAASASARGASTRRTTSCAAARACRARRVGRGMSLRAAPDYDVAGRTVFITGAARGIGAATAERLHATGANVALVGLEPELLEELAARLGERAAAFEADVTDFDALQRAVAGTVERFGGIDVGDRQRRASRSSARSRRRRSSRSSARSRSTCLGVWRTDRAVIEQIDRAPRLPAEHLLAARRSCHAAADGPLHRRQGGRRGADATAARRARAQRRARRLRVLRLHRHRPRPRELRAARRRRSLNRQRCRASSATRRRCRRRSTRSSAASNGARRACGRRAASAR